MHTHWIRAGLVLIAGFFVFATTVSVDERRPLEGATVAQAGQMSLGGRRLSCSRGTAINDSRMGALGLASPSRQVFWLNKRLLRKYPRAFQQFVFLHECAHMFTRDETEADCWAIKRGVFRGYFTRGSIDQICKALWNTPAGLYHNAGPQRCDLLKQCFANARG